MKQHVLRILAVLSLLLAACDDVIVPGDPVSTPKESFTISGHVVPVVFPVSRLDTAVQPVLLWHRYDASVYVYGVGSIDIDQLTWSITVNGPLPDGAWMDFTGTGAKIFGQASIVLVDGARITSGRIYSETDFTSSFRYRGGAVFHNVIYDTDSTIGGIVPIPFLTRFPAGFSAAVSDTSIQADTVVTPFVPTSYDLYPTLPTQIPLILFEPFL